MTPFIGPWAFAFFFNHKSVRRRFQQGPSLWLWKFHGPLFPALEAKQSAGRYLCRNVEDVFLLFLLKGDDCSCSKEPRRVGLLCWKFLAVCCAVKMLSKTIKLMVGHTAAAVLGTMYIWRWIFQTRFTTRFLRKIPSTSIEFQIIQNCVSLIDHHNWSNYATISVCVHI